jgi:glucose-6-phosphate isomerase, archaeal
MLGWDGELPPPAVRTIADMRPVLASLSCQGDDPLYFMYRDLAKSDVDWHWLHSHNLRYDLTIIPPRDLCGEWVKTKGHYHPENAAGTGYPEIYEVLEGRAHYLLQSRTLDDIVLIQAQMGEIVLIPPGYGHITINPTKDETLVMANIVSTAFESEYREYENLHGAAYYEMVSGQLKKNMHYKAHSPIRHIRPKSGRGDHRIVRGPIYNLIGNAGAVDFLNRPEKYADVFKVFLKD